MLGSVLGVVGLVAAILAWRGSRVALRVAAGAMVVITLTGAAGVLRRRARLDQGPGRVSVVLTVAAVVLMFSASRRPVPVTD